METGTHKKTFVSELSGKEFPIAEKITGRSVRPSLIALMQKDFPGFAADKSLSLSELDQYREKYISEYLAREVGELSELEKTVVSSLSDNSSLAA